MIPARIAPYVFGLIVSGLMSCLVSGVSTFRALGIAEGFVASWMTAWLISWSIAFPTMLIVSPLARRLVDRLT